MRGRNALSYVQVFEYMKTVYLDYAATSPLDERVLEKMLPSLKETFGNASSVHQRGRQARFQVESCREEVADILGAEPGEIIFTSGGTESDNTAIRGVLTDDRPHLITSAAEHEAVLRPAEQRKREGLPTSILIPEEHGAVSAEQVAAAIRPDTGLVSLMHVNNEIGTITDLPAISEVCSEHDVPLHTDAVQSAGLLDINVDRLGVDLLSISAHKFYGPKGVGLLYVRGGVDLEPLLRGGKQERDRRAGTENLTGIVGLTEALRLAQKERDERIRHLRSAQEALVAGIQKELDGIPYVFNTPVEEAERGEVRVAPHIINVSFRPDGDEPVDGEMLLLNLDMRGVQASAGSACTSGALEPSHVLTAIGRERMTGSAAVRFSIGRFTSIDDVSYAVEVLAKTVRRMYQQRQKTAAS